jgi:hypothetical protein
VLRCPQAYPGILLVLSTCTAPAREAAFHRWYEDIHVADILETGVFHTAYRDESLAPKRRRPPPWRSLIHTAVSFASFFLTVPVERHLNTALLGAGPTEMMQDYPLHV